MHLFWDGVISTSFIDAVRVKPRNTTKGSLPEWALIGRRRGRHVSSNRMLWLQGVKFLKRYLSIFEVLNID